MASIGAQGPTDLTVKLGQSGDVAPQPKNFGQGGYGGYGSYGNPVGPELSLALLWRVAWEWRWLVLATFGVGIAAAVLATLLTPLEYRSVATLELNPPQVEALDESRSGSRSSGASFVDQNFLGTQIGLLQSQALAERVAQDLNLASEPVIVGDDTGGNRAANVRTAAGYVRGGLSVKLVPQSRLVRLNFESRDPALAARIVNGAAEAYINTNLERRYQSSSYARDFLQRQIATTRRSLENSERQLVNYAQQQRIITTGDSKTGDTGSLTGESLVSLNAALSQAQARRYAAEQRFREAAAGGRTSEASASTAGLRSQLATLNAEYQLKLQTFRPDYPEMVALRAQIAALRESITAETRSAASDRAGSLRAEFQASLAEENRLRQRVDELSSSVLNQRGRRIQYTILQRDVDTNRALYDALLQRYKEIGVAAGIGTSNASIVDRGDVPGGAFSPNLYLNLLVGAALGLLLGLGSALALEFINDTIKTPDDVRDKLRLPFLGGIPVANGKPVDELRDPLSSISEAYLSTASALQFVTEGGTPRTLLVTSTRPAEGKSTTAWALAQSFTRLGKSVLLIDADMRRPAFVTGDHGEIGLSHILTNASALADHVLRTEVENLWMMPSGPIPPSPPELLASTRFAALLAEAAETFDTVVIDGPPILGLADAPMLSAYVQATLLVVEAGRTRTRAVTEAFNRMRTAGARVVGCVLTRYKPQTAYGYGYGYGKDQGAYRYVAEDDDRRRRILLTVRHD